MALKPDSDSVSGLVPEWLWVRGEGRLGDRSWAW